MIKIPDFVFKFLIRNDYIGRTRTLIIGENYPNPDYSVEYFYRSLPNCPGNPELASTQARLFNCLCNALGIRSTSNNGDTLTEYQRLIQFLDSGYLLIDAQVNGIEPMRPAILTDDQIDELILTILLVNPVKIIFIHNNNSNVLSQLNKHDLFYKISSKISYNELKENYVFAYPAPPADPNIFKMQIDKLLEKLMQ